ncbi:hypothetical protein O3P69_013216 [Scylla paramamosain]|uniref:Uncharacterized protein n=1 Tax=Scylla paramamosain TaxID=85552 RepID=A0AAW0U2M1_SCYPA
MAVWRRLKTSVSLFILLVIVLYIGYCTQELYYRVQKTQKLKRLKSYETEIKDLTDTLQQYKIEASNVQRSLKLLQEAFDQIVNNQKTEMVNDR